MIKGNLTDVFGGGISCEDNSNCFIINNTITANLAMAMGGGISVFSSDATILNSILRADSAGGYPNEIFGSVKNVTYSDIQNGWQGEGNLDTNPWFRDPYGGDYHLMSISCGDSTNSPCIDAGDPATFDDILDCDRGLGSERADMGAYGGAGIPTNIGEPDHEIELPAHICLSQNYPNPFNSSTIISYSLPTASFVRISIYNVLGELVENMFVGEQSAGRQSIAWNADNYPSGIYFVRVETGYRFASIRMVLLK